MHITSGRGGLGKKTNDSVATTSSLDLVAATFPKSDSPQLFFACSKSKGKLAFVS